MRILHVTWEYPPLVYGGLGRHVYELASAQAEAGHDVAVVTQQVEGAPAEALMWGVRVLRVASAPQLEFIPENLLAWVSALDHELATGARVALGDAQPDVVHCHDWMTTKAGTELTENPVIPLVATIHATEVGRHQGHLPGDISRSVDAIERQLCHQANAVITCSAAMKEEVVRQFSVAADKVTVIPNGIDLEEWSSPLSDQLDARARWAPDSPLIVFVGRLEVEKGILELAEAMAQVRQALPTAHLVIAGRGSQGELLRNACESHGITGAVTVAGWLPEQELRALIACADVAAIPSIYEPFGLVALEAMSLGTPVVASRVGGLADVVRSGETGWSVPAKDPTALAKALVAAITDRSAKVIVDRAYEALKRDHDWSQIAEATVACYRRAGADDS